VLDYVELTLAVAGLIPGPVGTAASLVGTVVAAWRGNWGSAALSALGAFPVIGSLANAIKVTRIGAAAAARLGKATSALARTAEVAAAGGKAILIARVTTSGSLLWRAAYHGYDFVFCVSVP